MWVTLTKKIIYRYSYHSGSIVLQPFVSNNNFPTTLRLGNSVILMNLTSGNQALEVRRLSKRVVKHLPSKIQNNDK